MTTLLKDKNVLNINEITSKDVLRGQNITLDLIYNGKEINANVWSINPFFIEIKYFSEIDFLPWGEVIDLRVNIEKEVMEIKGLLPNLSSKEKNDIVLIYFKEEKSRNEYEENNRKSLRYHSHDKFYPTAFIHNPFELNDLMYFKVENISNDGFFLTTSLRNKLLLKGLVLDCTFDFPMSEKIMVKLKIINIRVVNTEDKSELGLGVAIVDNNDAIKSQIAEYLFQFTNIKSFSDFKQNGYTLKTLLNGVNFRFSKSKEDFEKVLKLRFLSYKSSGKISEDDTYEMMEDKYDEKSRIVIGEYQGEIICSTRLTFHEVSDHFEQEEYVKWSSDLPTPQDSLEISRLCIDPSYQKEDVLLGMFRFMALHSIRSQRNYLVMSSTEKMCGFYKKVGFKTTDKVYSLPLFKNLKHRVCIAHTRSGISGKGCNPIYWNIVWSDLVKFLSKNHLNYELTVGEKLRMTFYSLFSSLAMRLNRKVRRNK